jgi:alpha-mannosidase
VVASHAVHDTGFAVIQRALAPTEPRGTEDIYPTVPHRTWSAIESTDVSVAIFSRGLYELEARPESAGTSLLLTLLRCVGWLSRSDLATRRGGAGPELETPGAQEMGEHRVEFALATYRGSYLGAGLVQRAAAYAYPPRLFAAAGAPRDDLSLVGCDNPRIAFSTARLISRAGVYRVRVYSASPNPERARFTFGDGASVRLIDLRGNSVRGRKVRRLRGGYVELELRPFEIVTFEIKGSVG